MDENSTSRRRQEGIRRACNECRQQKLRCDVVKDPSSTCSRCRKLHLVCKVDATFKRIEKRKSKNARRQIDQQETLPAASTQVSSPLRALLTSADDEDSMTAHVAFPIVSLPTAPERGTDSPNSLNSKESISMPTHPIVPLLPGSETSGPERIDGVCPHGSAPSGIRTGRKLDDIELTANDIQELFDQFFNHYHPFLPFLDPLKSPDSYFQSSRLLFWVIISVASRRYASDLTLLAALSISVPRLLWSVLQSVPQNYHDIKALCLLCTWPFPMSSSSRDPTFMLSGTMMNLAMQVGLHRPSQAQDFSKFTVRMPPEEIQDRIATWYTCKIVAQSVSTGYGQPSVDIFDDSFGLHLENGSEKKLSLYLRNRSRIEALCNRISKCLHPMTCGSWLEQNEHRGIMETLNQELLQLQSDFTGASRIIFLYLKCAELHLRLYNLFGSTTSPDYIGSLLSLYDACEDHLSLLLDTVNADILAYCPNYVFQITLACGFTVLKLIQSPALDYMDAISSKKAFNSAIVAMRKISVSNNDLPGRFAEVLVQLKARGSYRRGKGDWGCLQLKIRSRMSVSVRYDSLWEWTKAFESDAKKQRPEDSHSNGGNHNYPPAPPDNGTYAFPMQQSFNLEDLTFDDFYSMNWVIENAEMTQYPL